MPETPVTSPRPITLTIDPENVNFANCAPGSRPRRKISLKHLAGDGTIEVTKAELAGDPAFHRGKKVFPLKLKPGQEETLWVYYRPTDATEKKARLSVTYTVHAGSSEDPHTQRDADADIGVTAQVNEAIPEIVEVSPSGFAVDVDRNITVKVVYSARVDLETVTDENLTLTNKDTDQPVPCLLWKDKNHGTTISLEPQDRLDASTVYTAGVEGGNSGPKDRYGRSLLGKKWSFQTRHARMSQWSITLFALVLLVAVAGGAAITIFGPILSDKTVVLRRDLRPYTVISPSDISSTSTILAPAQAVAKTEDALGRVTTGPLSRGTILTSSRFVDLPEGTPVPDSWQFLSVPYPSATVSPLTGQRVKLIGVRADDDAPDLVSSQALTIVRADRYLVVALPPKEAERAALYLSGGDSSASQPPGGDADQPNLQVVLKNDDQIVLNWKGE